MVQGTRNGLNILCFLGVSPGDGKHASACYIMLVLSRRRERRPGLRFDRYLNYEELAGTLGAFEGGYPELCEVVSIGQSRAGREILLAEITNRETGPASEKPAFWVTATPTPAR